MGLSYSKVKKEILLYFPVTNSGSKLAPAARSSTHYPDKCAKTQGRTGSGDNETGRCRRENSGWHPWIPGQTESCRNEVSIFSKLVCNILFGI